MPMALEYNFFDTINFSVVDWKNKAMILSVSLPWFEYKTRVFIIYSVISTCLELAYLELRSISNQFLFPLDFTGIFSVNLILLISNSLISNLRFSRTIFFLFLVQKYPLYLEQV